MQSLKRSEGKLRKGGDKDMRQEQTELRRPDGHGMIAQWENECISVSVLSLARVYDSSVGELRHLSVCALCGPGL